MLMERKGEFDGVLAFSEGASLAAALITRYTRENPFDSQGLFRFAIFACGLVHFNHASLNDNPGENLKLGSNPERVKSDICLLTGSYLINIPTFHLLGRNDGYFEYGMALYQCCDPQVALKVVHNGGHQIPNHPVELVDEIVRMSRATIMRAEFRC